MTPKITKYDVTPYSARVLILKLEQEYNITIRVHEGTHYCILYIDKEVRKDE